MRIFFFLLLLLPVGAEAKPSSLRDPLARIRQNLALLERVCQRMAAPEKGECSAAHELASVNCRKVAAAFTLSSEKAVALVREAVAWRKRRSMMTESKDTISISFSLSSDPTYPFHKTDAISNAALDASNEAINAVADKIEALKKQKSCRGSLGALETLWQQWEGDRGDESVVDFHNSLGADISGFLVDAQRRVEAGALEEALASLKEALPGTEIKKVR